MNIILPNGGYKKLKSYQKSKIVYDYTVYFCNKYFNKYDRTIGQMVQAARSCKQNIIDGSKASAISVNCMIGLIMVNNYLLDRQLKFLADDFVKHGGLRERMTKARLEEKNKKKGQ